MKKLAKEEVLRIVRELHSRLDVIYGERLKGVYLFGSYARGDARDDSDIDVAVVLAGEVDRLKDWNMVGDATAAISLEDNCLLTAFIMSDTDQTGSPYPIHRRIRREGIAV